MKIELSTDEVVMIQTGLRRAAWDLVKEGHENRAMDYEDLLLRINREQYLTQAQK
jgi:hypothetical protein